MQQLQFTGRTAAVTGASGGLGHALIGALRNAGAQVTGISRQYSTPHTPATWNPADYDLVIFNAGFGYMQPSDAPLYERNDVTEMFTVNLLQVIDQAQSALAAGALHVHVVGSILSIVSCPYYAIYAATKYGLRGWAYGAARELPGRVSISYPNGIRTPYFQHLRGDPALLAAYAGQVEQAQQQYDTPDAVAQGILAGIASGAREIIPTTYALEWFIKNGEDIGRMWHPRLSQPSVEPFDWWKAVATYYDSL